MAPFSNGLSLGVVQYLIHHVFLPPELPQKDDFNTEYESVLIDTTIDALWKFKAHLPDHQSLSINPIIVLMNNLKSVHTSGSIDDERLKTALKVLSDGGEYGTIPLHVRAQNAGLLLSKVDNSIRVEAFELSPLNEAVFATKGRLRRSFPGAALDLKREAFEQPTFRATIADTLATMSHQKAPGTQPQARKAGQMHNEERDKTHPKMITELFLAFLGPLAQPVDVPRLIKNTREELLVRVAIQLELFRLAAASNMPTDTYKLFMVFLLSYVLELSHRIMQDTDRDLQAKWLTITKNAEPSCNLSRLGWLEFDSDTSIVLPALDQYLRTMENRKATNPSASVQRKYGPKKYPADELPSITAFSNSDLVVHDLKAVEAWVEHHLGTWLNHHKGGLTTCGKLAVLIRSYHAIAHTLYTDNPEATSIMLLTSLELWIAGDESATHICGLLKDYDPGIPRDVLTSLVLPFKSQMQRLLHVEDYLVRRSRAKFRAPHIFQEFGSQNSFAVQYFTQSAEHRQLLQKIEKEAAEARQRKREELLKKKVEYDSWMKLRDSVDHDTHEVVTDVFNDFREQKHRDGNCKKCDYQSKADKVEIKVHEWPLPSASLEAQATVFELNVPPWFGHWRDTAVFVIVEVLKAEYVSAERSRNNFPLHEDVCGLSTFFTPFSRERRIGILSQNKPHMGTHRHGKGVSDATESQVCLNSELRYEYHDAKLGCFVSSFQITDKTPKSCTFTLPQKLSYLQQFLFRPASTPHGPSPNAVMASQSECPDGMSIDEYRALSTLPLGCRIQWQNILLQLVMPIVDLKKIETGLVILQAIYQAGPASGGNVLREGHAIVGNLTFVETLLTALDRALQRIKENWESSQVLGTLVTLATRILSLTTSEEIRDKSLAYLVTIREISFKWVNYLKEKARKSTDDHQRAELRSKVVELALICADSFNLEGTCLNATLSIQKQASVFLQCSIKGLSYRSYNIVRRDFLQGKNESVDDAIKKSWSAYQAGDSWQIMSRDLDHWLVSRTAVGSGGVSLSVHFNLLTGELLVNGLPLARLPQQYERHPMYRTLFGQLCLEVMPTTAQGMQFSGKKEFSDYILHFNIESVLDEAGKPVGSDLIVQAVKGDRKYQLIPSRLILGEFPSAFIDNFIHWYNINNDSMEFRPAEDPWTESPDNWKLIRTSTGSKWRLMKHEASLVGVKSETGKLISKLLSPLQDASRIHNIFHHSSSSVDIELPRLQLGFYLKSHNSTIESRQFRGMFVDVDQSLGTLLGLCDKLILKHERSGHRLVIIPEGEVMHVATSGHVRVNIKKDSATKAHAYRVDSHIGRLVDNGSLQSKLFLCYLHGLTSFCLPDPLIKRTGTKQALSILDSAAVRSFVRLTQKEVEILNRIAELTPERKFYPQNERVMQSVTWSGKLGFMAQHGRFHISINSILDQAKTYTIFDPSSCIKRLRLDRVQVHLLERDLIRSSTVRVSGFGAEEHTVNYDSVYLSRDRAQNSAQGFKAFVMSSIMDNNATLKLSRNPELYNRTKHIDVRYHFLRERAMEVKDLFTERIVGTENVVDVLTKPLALKKFKYFMGKIRVVNMKDLDNSIAIEDLDSNVGDNCVYFSLEAPTLCGISSLLMVNEALCLRTSGYKPGVALPLCDLKYSDKQLLEPLKIPSEYWSSLHNVLSRSAPRFEKFGFMMWLSTLAFAENANMQILQSLAFFFSAPDVIRMSAPLLNSFHLRKGSRVNTSNLRNAFRVALLPFPQSPDAKLPQQPRETLHALQRRRQSTFQSNQTQAVDKLLKELEIQWPCEVPVVPSCYTSGTPSPYIDISKAIQIAKPDFKTWFENHRYDKYLEAIADALRRQQISPLTQPLYPSSNRILNTQRKQARGFVGIDDIFARSTPDLSDCDTQNINSIISSDSNAEKPILRLSALLQGLESQTSSSYEKRITSMTCVVVLPLCTTGAVYQQDTLVGYLDRCQKHVHRVYDAISSCLTSPNGSKASAIVASVKQWPRVSPIFLLQQLSRRGWQKITPDWQMCIVQYGRALTDLHRAERLLSLAGNHTDLFRELQNPSHTNWNPLEYPESLLLEVESSIMIREVQEQIAEQMRSPKSGANTVMQLNMGEGKSSVIVPIVAASLADGSRLVRVIVAKPQSKEMFQMLVSKLGELVDRRVYHMPFSRSIKLGQAEAAAIGKIYRECMDNSGILLVQPEHILSFKLMGLECFITNKEKVGSPLLSTQQFFDKSSRDIMDESDENFSVKFELIYTMGTQRPIEFSPDRWVCIQHLLDLVKAFAPSVRKLFPDSISINDPGGVLAFALGQKRWRVNYGLDVFRKPTTRLAVPYRAKDNPTARSEFSHPDVVIVLTSLTYYYGELRDDDIFIAFYHLVKSDQADIEYQAWCIEEVFPPLRFAKSVIDYFLAHIVFPKEMKEFPYKLSASGWDIGQPKTHPITGFGGTNDSRKLLPLSVGHLDLPEQQHTNALVLEYLLGPENSVALMQCSQDASSSDAQSLLAMVTAMEPTVQVILDVGAQILELSNLDVAKQWLRMMPSHSTQAVVFFNDNDELCVINRKDNIEALQTSSFATQLDVCLVYLDEAHIRGTDLKLPTSYRAAVTLGPNLTKDRLVQERCEELDNLQFDSATLREEQERELSLEIEQERQVQKPAPARPATHHLHPDLVKFVSTGNLIPASKAYMPAFQAMRTTSAAAYLNVSQFPQDLLVTTDFANTIQVSNATSYVSDYYQRPVNWILTSTGAPSSKTVKCMLIISPFEAQRIMPDVSVSKTTTLHLYAPRPTLGFRALDALDLFTVPSRPELILPRHLVVLLNLFAGQLYLESFKEYIEVCELLGLAWDKSEEGCVVAADGFILQNDKVKSTFKNSPTRFLKVLMTKVRRNCESIEKTHMGKILDGRLLTRADFEEVEDEN
ncbi:uncharacterized protein PAC_06796 [Phialocephala subalpina]|uniref:ubiquitinyl hydrolase 1 n=1 Tax=Phialocephala subalpina TaxID=576137 RepID=A0A1L7WVW6_9HELO|nr:uncharacterized protein PAC_06796 [Phialocephala subalpina]